MNRYSFFWLALIVLTGLACGNDTLTEKEVEEILVSQAWQYDEPSIWKEVDQLDLGENKRNSLDETLERLEGGYFRFEPDSVLFIQPGDSTVEPIRGRWRLVNHGKALVMEPSIHIMPPQMIREITKDKIILEIDNHNGYFFPKIMVPYKGEQN